MSHRRHLDSATVACLAARLDAAERRHAPIGHFSAEPPAMTIADACAIGQARVAAKSPPAAAWRATGSA